MEKALLCFGCRRVRYQDFIAYKKRNRDKVLTERGFLRKLIFWQVIPIYLKFWRGNISVGIRCSSQQGMSRRQYWGKRAPKKPTMSGWLFK